MTDLRVAVVQLAAEQDGAADAGTEAEHATAGQG